MKRKINWEEIYQAYTFGIPEDGTIEFPTLKNLSDIYKVSIAALKEHSIKEKWTEARENYLKDKRTKTEQKVIEKISDKIAPFDTFLFGKVDQFVRGIGEMIDHIFPTIDKKEGQELAKTSEIVSVKTTDLLNIINSLKQAKELEESVIGKGHSGGNDRTEDIEKELENLRSAIESSKDNDI